MFGCFVCFGEISHVSDDREERLICLCHRMLRGHLFSIHQSLDHRLPFYYFLQGCCDCVADIICRPNSLLSFLWHFTNILSIRLPLRDVLLIAQYPAHSCDERTFIFVLVKNKRSVYYQSDTSQKLVVHTWLCSSLILDFFSRGLLSCNNMCFVHGAYLPRIRSQLPRIWNESNFRNRIRKRSFLMSRNDKNTTRRQQGTDSPHV